MIIVTGMFSSPEPSSSPLHHACVCQLGKPSRPYPPQKTTPRAQQKREQGIRLEDESSTLGLLVTTQLEVLASLESELCLGLEVVSVDRGCSSIIYRTLQAVHSRRSTTFLVVFALCNAVSAVLPKNVVWIVPCGRRAWSDHHNRSAYDHNDAFPGRTARPFQPCTG